MINPEVSEKLAGIVQQLPDKKEIAVILRYGGVDDVTQKLEKVREELLSIIDELKEQA